MTDVVLGLGVGRWMALVAALLTLLVMVESWIGHYRSGFPLRMQYAPLAAGSVLVVASVAAALAPDVVLVQLILRATGWLAVVAGVIGVGYHHRYGIAEKAGGYRWLLHYLMYGAPQLAPLALSVAGAVGIVASHALAHHATVAGIALPRALLALVSIALAGAIVQSGILHYRGAFNTPLMYAPLVLPPLAMVGAAWLAAAPGARVVGVTRAVLWATFLLGFVGLGMHLRGLDRQMGGLHVFLFNLLQGPPPLAPAVFTTLAAAGLLALEGY
ncbi:MAG TPA: hypothetical protein VGE02_07150 [Gemmatimonadales bacterium]